MKLLNLTSLSCLWDCSLNEYKDLNKRHDAIMELKIPFGVGKVEIERKIKIVKPFSSSIGNVSGGLAVPRTPGFFSDLLTSVQC